MVSVSRVSGPEQSLTRRLPGTAGDQAPLLPPYILALPTALTLSPSHSLPSELSPVEQKLWSPLAQRSIETLAPLGKVDLYACVDRDHV